MNRPPHNPGVRELVANKRRYSHQQTSAEGKQGFRGWHERGYLPHFDAPGLTQFITFGLADVFPQHLRSEWAHLVRIEGDSVQRRKLEDYLDRGHGEVWLKQPQIGAMVESALRFFDGERYELRAWVVMPNHVHVLIHVSTFPVAEIIESWKSFTAKEANKLLGRTGRFWRADYWDTFMRDAGQEAKAVRYIENNPTRAHLVREPGKWPWSSARWRDEFGRLSERTAPVRGAAASQQAEAMGDSDVPLANQPLRPGGPRSGERARARSGRKTGSTSTLPLASNPKA